MSAGHEDLARAALERKQLAVQEAGSLDQQLAQLESDERKLIESGKQLRAKIEQLRSKKDVIKAQYFKDLTALDPGENDVDCQLYRLDQLGAKSAVDDEFARLKAEVQSGAPHAALLADDASAADHGEGQQPADDDREAAPPVSVSSPDPQIGGHLPGGTRFNARGCSSGSLSERWVLRADSLETRRNVPADRLSRHRLVRSPPT